MTDPLVTFAKGGTDQHTVHASEIEIPDLWHLAMRLDGQDREMVLRCWHIAHDLARHITGAPDLLAACRAALEYVTEQNERLDGPMSMPTPLEEQLDAAIAAAEGR